MTSPDRCIIIGSGRCGSTLLSDLIAEEPQTLSVQESLIPLIGSFGAKSDDRTIAGVEYWTLLSRPDPQWMTMIRIGAKPAEFRYPGDGRWAGDLAALPPVLVCCLPAISADPDQLFDILQARVPHFPRQPVAAHHQMFLDLLTAQTGRRRWVERSGASSAIAGLLLRTFSTAKVIYLTRNLADTALSMSRHSAFQFLALRLDYMTRCGVDPYSTPDAPDRKIDSAEFPEAMRHLLPDQLTAAALRDMGRDVRRYELMCALLMNTAEHALAECRPPHLLRMTYEDLVAEPVAELARLGDFLGFTNVEGWVAKVAGRVSRDGRRAQPTSAGANAAGR